MPPKKSPRVKLTLSVPEDIDRRLRILAAEQRTAISTVAIEAFIEYLGKDDKKSFAK